MNFYKNSFASCANKVDEDLVWSPWRLRTTNEYKCYSKHFSDEIVENDFAYFIVENYEQSCRNVKEVLKRRE